MARSAVHHRYAALGATFERAHGWDLPVRFPYADKPRTESADVVLGDESAVGKVLLEGSEVAARGLEAAQGLALTSGAHVVYRPRPDQLLVLVPLERRDRMAEAIAASGASGCLHAVDLSSSYASFVLAGPDAPEVLASLATTNLAALAEGGATACSLGGHPCVVGRHAAGWRILVGRDEAEDLWELVERFEPDLAVASWDTVREWLW